MEHIWKGVLIVGLLLLVVAIFQPVITGHVTKEYDEQYELEQYELEKYSDTQAEEYTQEQMEADVKQAKIFFKFISLLFAEDPVVESPAPVGSGAGCCTDVTALQQKVNELESKVKQLEQRNSQSCQFVRITSGSCQQACQAKSLRCTAATNTRTKTEHPIIGNSYQTEVFSHPVACDYNWYMPGDPDLKDAMECSCC